MGWPCAALDEVLEGELCERGPWQHTSDGTRPPEPKGKVCGYALGNTHRKGAGLSHNPWKTAGDGFKSPMTKQHEQPSQGRFSPTWFICRESTPRSVLALWRGRKTLVVRRQTLRRKQMRVSIDLFKSKPRSSVALAALCLTMGVLNLTDWIPASPSRPFRQEYGWVMSVLSLALAVLFIYCAIVGFRSLKRDRNN